MKHAIMGGVLAACFAVGRAAASDISQGPEAAEDMAWVYGTICLGAFPAQPAVQAALAGLHATPMTDADTQAALDGDPGRGWRVTTKLAEYTVTIEDPPYNTCAVRRMTRQGLPTALPYIASLQNYARAKSLLMGQLAPLEETLTGGADRQVLATPLGSDPARKPTQSSMYVTTDYHGHYTGRNALDADGGDGVEIKMAHQITVAP
jgi:hypothetical protein